LFPLTFFCLFSLFHFIIIGGLLVTATINQHPEYFGAAVAQVPVAGWKIFIVCFYHSYVFFFFFFGLLQNNQIC
jgi:hypothetical protein